MIARCSPSPLCYMSRYLSNGLLAPVNKAVKVLVLAAHLAPTCPAPGSFCLVNRTLRSRPGELRPNL